MIPTITIESIRRQLRQAESEGHAALRQAREAVNYLGGGDRIRSVAARLEELATQLHALAIDADDLDRLYGYEADEETLVVSRSAVTERPAAPDTIPAPPIEEAG